MSESEASMPLFVPDAIIKGVWGSGSRNNSQFNGGMECAQQSSA